MAAADTNNQDVDELLRIAMEKLLSIASALINNGATSINPQQESVVESEVVFSEDQVPEAGTHNGARSSSYPQASIETSEAPSIAGYDDIIPGMLVTNAIQGLLFGIQRFGISKSDSISRGVFNVAETLAERSGKKDDTVMYLEQVLAYMDNTPELDNTVLHCRLLYTYGIVFTHQGHMENAKRALYSAQRIATTRSDTADVEMLVWVPLINLHKELGEEQLLQTARMTYLELCEPKLQSTSTWPDGVDYTSVLQDVGRTCFDIGLTSNDMERMDDGLGYLTEALKNAASQPLRQASLMLQLAECYYQHPGLNTGQHACLILLEQAIAGFQQLECTCGSDSVDDSTSWGGTGVIACGRHQRLADAFSSLGIVQRNQGFMEEAQQSFERGLELVEECNDDGRAADFHLTLAVNHFLQSSMNVAFGLQKMKDFPDPVDTLLHKPVFDHFREFMKKTRPGASFHQDRMAIFVRALLNPPADLNEGTLGTVMALQEILQMGEERGFRSGNAYQHQSLSVQYLRLGDVEACKHELSLALKALEEVPTSTEMSVQVLQPLGWIAMDAKILDFDCAYEIWQRVYSATEEMLEKMVQIGEEHAFRYFEVSKHACMALAKCQLFRAQAVVESEKQLARRYEESALVWAERGKGRMLMSFIAASTQSYDDPASHFDKSRFLTDDAFALNFICNRPRASPALVMSQSRKTVFVGFIFLDYENLMIQIVVDGPGPVSTLHSSLTISLPRMLSEGTRHEAETNLNSVHDSSEATQNSTNPLSSQSNRSTIQNVLSAMNKYSTNRIPFNPWIPGMVVGIQKHVGEAIEKLSRDSNSRCERELYKISELLQALYAVLIKPIQEQLAAVYEHGRDTLVFLPHEDLSIVPFAALHEYEGSPYLIEDYAISVSPSVWCTRHCQQLYEKTLHEVGAVPVLVGKRSGYPREYPDLKQAHKEVDAVAEAIGSTVKMVLKDDELSHARMIEVLPNASWIHLCVHGEVSSQFPQGSLLFGNNVSQRLTAEKIMTVASSAWRARAVVLSACQTGLGSVAGGGIMGFARSFILVGVPTSILTMWQADDKFCTEFMKKLYEQLAKGDRLAYAMQEVIVSKMHEYKKGKRKPRELKWSIIHWACFSCLGFPSVIFPTSEEQTNAAS